MKKIIFLTFVAAFALALAGCETTKETNSNKAVVLDNNANMVNKTMVNTTNTNMATGKVTYDKEITREEYDKNKDRYTTDAKEAGGTIGQGAEDGWLWTKTKTALATTNDLRDSTINVDVENSVVTLRGTVASKTEMEKAVKVAQEVKDVKSVKNMLKVVANDSMTNQAMTDDPSTKSNANMKK
ncbi:MAG: BON domain-containing protein [Acidobacteriota bacterium]